MSKLIFVTGASGFLASHVINELLKQGYRVRGSARGSKLTDLREQYNNIPAIEFVEVKDVAKDQFPLEGVDAIIHTASPLPGGIDAEKMFDSAIEGTLNILRQGEAAGIRKFVVTSSIASLSRDPSIVNSVYRDHHWNPVTKESALASKNEFVAYGASKKYAELATWDWAEKHPHVDVTTLNPPFLYGPLSPLFKPKKQASLIDAISTNSAIYNLLNPKGSYPSSPHYVDVRDVARAHVGALSTPATVKGRKRVITASPYDFDYGAVVELIREERPALAGRLITLPLSQLEYTNANIDYDRHREITGMGKEDFHTVQQTMLDAVDSLIELEAQWGI